MTHPDHELGCLPMTLLLLLAFALVGIMQYIETSTHPPDKFDRIDSYSSDGNVIHTYVPKSKS